MEQITGIESQLEKIWVEVFENQDISCDDDFLDVGGNSILAMKIISRIYEIFQIEISPRTFFRRLTIKKLALYVQKGEKPTKAEVTCLTKEKSFKLSKAQERLFFLDKLEPDFYAYNIHKAFYIKGSIKPEILEKSITHLVSRHDMLRASFSWETDSPKQSIQNDASFKLIVKNIPYNHYDEHIKKDILRLIQDYIKKPFELSTPPLFRLVLFKLRNKHNVLLIVMHHIISDAWTFQLFFHELGKTYEALAKKRQLNTESLNFSYFDYINWQENQTNPTQLLQIEKYWKNQLKDLTYLNLPTKNSSKITQKFIGKQITKSIPSHLTKNLYKIRKKLHTSLYICLLSAFIVLLYRYTNQKDITIGTVVVDRKNKKLENLIGLFENILVVRQNLSENLSFHDLFHQVIKTTMDSFDHKEIPFQDLVNCLHIEREINRNPIFDVMFIFDNTPKLPFSINGLEIISENYDPGTARFPLSLTITESQKDLSCEFSYDTHIFSDEIMENFAVHFIDILENLVENEEQTISSFTLTDQQKSFPDNKTTPSLNIDSDNRSIMDLFEAAAFAHPNNIAITHKKKNISYLELKKSSDELKHHLSQEGVSSGDIIGLSMQHSESLIIALLALLKLGAIYLPLPPEMPNKKKEAILSQASPKYILLDTTTKTTDENKSSHKIFLHDPKIKSLKKHAGLTKKNIAYIIYTSGTTGIPKGVLCTHIGLANTITSISKALDFTPKNRMLWSSAISFDISMLEIFLPLTTGGTLHIPTKNVIRHPDELIKILNTAAITHIQATPETWRLIFQLGWKGNKNLVILSGGDILPYDLAKNLISSSKTVWNLYGPTETTIWSSIAKLNPKDEFVSIGSPIDNMHFYVLDDNGKQMPQGTIGNLYIAGKGLSIGYYEDAALSQKNFLQLEIEKNNFINCYKTGDLVKHHPNGQYEFIGRSDNQIKLRGLRLEPEEIRSLALSHPNIKNAAVLVKQEDNSTELVLYIQEKDINNPLNKKLFIQFLSQYLQNTLLPQDIIFVKDIPLTESKKIDYKNLIHLENICSKKDIPKIEFISPEQDFLMHIWRQVLKNPTIQLDDNFFEYGGNSLQATQIVVRIQKYYKKEISLREFFLNPTIRKISNLLKKSQFSKTSGFIPIKRYDTSKDTYPLSFAQQRILFHQNLAPCNTFYNLPIRLKLTGKLNIVLFKKAVTSIIKQQELLRTYFLEIDSLYHQKIASGEPFQIHVEDISHLESTTQNQCLENAKQQSFKHIFALNQWPLFLIKLFVLSEGSYIVDLLFHHIVFDGWSLGIFIKNLAQAYDGLKEDNSYQLPELPIQYKDYAIWQKELLKNNYYDHALKYWKDKFSSGIPELKLPTDYRKTPDYRYEGCIYIEKTNKELANKLKKLALENESSLFMVLLAAFKVVLYKYSGQTELALGCPIANRSSEELEHLIGFFINILIVTTSLHDNLSFLDALQAVKESLFETAPYQDLPFDILVKELNPNRSYGLNPIVSTFFVLQNADMALSSFKNIKIKFEDLQFHTARFDLLLYATEEEDGTLSFKFEYNTSLFKTKTIERLSRHFKNALHEITNNTTKKISKIRMIDTAELNEILLYSVGQKTAYPKKKRIEMLFREVAEKNPSKIAIKLNRNNLTYQELNDKAFQLAQCLWQKGLRPKDYLAIHLNPFDSIVFTLAALRIGAVIVPINLNDPIEHITSILTTLEKSYIISETLSNEISLNSNNFQFLSIKDLEKAQTANLPTTLSAHDPAYIFFTSGSTGVPNPVMVGHTSISRLVLNTNYISVNPLDNVSQTSNLAFDASLFEIWGALLNAATLVLIDQKKLLEPAEFKKIVKNKQISIMWLSTQIFSQILLTEPNCFNSLRVVIIGGETVDVKVIRNFTLNQRNAPVTLINAYGSTEAVTFSTFYLIDKKIKNEPISIPVGKPLANTKVYVLDQTMHPSPIGVPGEIYIGGEGLSFGYLNNKILSSQKFIHTPFFKKELLYKTGDIGRWLESGDIEYIGRVDNMIKIRGFRVELDGIQSYIESHPLVKQAFVTYQETLLTHEKRIIAYYTIQNQTNSDTQITKNWARLFDATYKNTFKPKNIGKNFSGWLSSYNGKKISVSEMECWLEDTITKIKRLNPKKILEIGCGSGLLLMQLSKQADLYYGTDISHESLNLIQSQKNVLGQDFTNIVLLHQEANNFKNIPQDTFDTIIMNSVIQYFPDILYLKNVIKKGVQNLKKNGQIIIGDVRNFLLMKPFYFSIAKHDAEKNVSVAEFLKATSQHIKNEHELLVSPYFFLSLSDEIPEIKNVELLLKRGSFQNELNKYRFDVVLHIGEKNKEQLAPSVILDYQQNAFNVSQIEQILLLMKPDSFLIKNIKNSRLSSDFRFYKWATENKDLSKNLDDFTDKEEDNDRVDPELLYLMAEKNGYQPKLFLSTNEDETIFDILLLNQSTSYNTTYNHYQELQLKSKDLTTLSNKEEKSAILTPEQLHIYLKERLPSYMLPHQCLEIKGFPLNKNGKIDKNKLPQSRFFEPSPSTQKLKNEPSHDVRALLSSVWGKVLHINSVKPTDNFFELGGDSIISMQIASKMKSYGVQISAKDIYQLQTIESLAQNIEKQKFDHQENREPKTYQTNSLFSLSPIQQWFFETATSKNLHDWNQTYLFRIPRETKIDLLKVALKNLIENNLSFSLKYKKSKSTWQQYYASSSDITNELEIIQKKAIKSLKPFIDQKQKTLNIEEGPLFKCILIEDLQKESILVFIIHHLIIDGVSARILADELNLAYQALIKDQEYLPPAKAHYADWIKAQEDYASHSKLYSEMPYWKGVVLEIKKLYNYRNDKNNPPCFSTLEIILNKEKTSALQEVMNKIYKVKMNIALLAALGWSYFKKSQTILSLSMETHGRQNLESNLDISNTTGWFTSIYPFNLKLNFNNYQNNYDLLHDVQYQLLDIPNDGVGFGVLRYLSLSPQMDELNFIQEPQISFNYLGNFDHGRDKNQLFQFYSPTTGKNSPKPTGKFFIEINCGIMDHKLFVYITYNKDIDIIEIENLKRNFCDKLDDFIKIDKPTPISFPLSDLQEVYWLGRTGFFQYGNISPHFYMEFDCDAIDTEQLNKSWNQILDRHPALRIGIDKKNLQQFYLKDKLYKISKIDLTNISEKEKTTILNEIRAEMSEKIAEHPWAFFEIKHSILNNKKSRIHFSFDLLLTDQIGMKILLHDWAKMYYKQQGNLEYLTYDFCKYMNDLLALKNTKQYKKDYSYWLKASKDLPEAPNLPISHTCKQKNLMKRLSFKLEKKYWDNLKISLNDFRISPSVGICRAFADILSIWSSNKNFTINVLYNNRIPLDPQVDLIVGCCSSTLLIECSSSRESFTKRCHTLQETFLSAIDHSTTNISGSHVLRELNSNNRSIYNASMPIVFSSNLRNNHNKSTPAINFLGDNVYNSLQTPYVLLDHQVYEDEGDLIIAWDFLTSAFKPELINDMFHTYSNHLMSLATNSLESVSIPTLPIYQKAIIEKFNNNLSSAPEQLLHSAFLKTVKNTPRKTAVKYKSISYSYGELYELSLAVSYWLESNHQKNELVAIVLEKGINQIAAILGILISGNAYVPLDPLLMPNQRVRTILSSNPIKSIITSSQYLSNEKLPNINVLNIDNIDALDLKNQNLKPKKNHPKELAYVVFTSGTTGSPKGVMISHAAAWNTVCAINKICNISDRDKFAGISSCSFDLSVYDIFGPLSVGATLVLLPDKEKENPISLYKFILNEKITIWNSVPAIFDIFISALTIHTTKLTQPLRCVLLSGDWLPYNLAKKTLAHMPNTKLFNLGGATEASIWSIYYQVSTEIDKIKKIPYGNPLENQKIYILDDYLEFCPLWVEGEIYIGGKGLSNGYLNQPDNTLKSFVYHPTLNERLYKTGDYGRLLPNGQVELIGRKDNQVKIRGFRIELEEIEATALKHPSVKNCSATLYGNGDSKGIYLFIVMEHNTSLPALHKYLSKNLPSYMLPNKIQIIPSLPLTKNQKVDKKALLNLCSHRNIEDKKNEINNLNETIKSKVIEIWQELLPVKNINIHDNFFDLGGNSLIAMKILSKLQCLTDTPLSLQEIFSFPTVLNCVQIIDKSIKT